MALTCSSMVIIDVRKCFMHLLTVHMSSGKCLFRFLAHFFSQAFVSLLCCMTSLYILNISPFIKHMICNSYFPPFCCCLFILLTVSFARQMIFSLMWFLLFAFAFYCLCIWYQIQKNYHKGSMLRSLLSFFLRVL